MIFYVKHAEFFNVKVARTRITAAWINLLWLWTETSAEVLRTL
jgi:hypothetical protein